MEECIQFAGKVPYRLAKPHDFSFLDEYGEAFTVFDDQDSGNICFGLSKDGERYFVKFAGAHTARAVVSPQAATENLRRTAQIYRDLAHKNLVRLLDAREMGGGYALVFDWADGDCMGKQYPSSRERFLALPESAKMRVFSDVLDFHAHVARQGYVAVDFYDGSILFDEKTAKTTICDIDFYEKAPFINTMGRMWGSTRFMSPEEFEFGAGIDECTNVYAMGALAFELFAGGARERESWRLTDALFSVASRAVSAQRAERQQSIEQLISEWSDAQNDKS